MLENIQFIICLEKYFKFQIILKKTFLKINVYKKNIENEKLNIFKIKDFFINNKIKNIVKNINYYIDNFKKIQYQKISIFKNKYNFYIKNFFFKNKIKMDFNKNNIFYCFNKKIFIINLEKNVFNLFSFKIKYIQYIIKINFLNNFFFKTNNISFLNDNCFILLKRKINFFCLKENVNCFLKLNQILILLLNIKKKKKKIFLFLKNEKKIIFSLNKNYIFLKNIKKYNQILKLKIYIKKGKDFFFCFNSKNILNFIKKKYKFILINYFINNKIIVLKKYFTLLKNFENCFKTIGYM